LGHGNDKDIFLPLQVTALADVVLRSIKCGVSHMAVLTDQKQIYTWGNNFLGTLGRFSDDDFDALPRMVEIVQVASEISEHSLKRSDDFEWVQVECLEFNTFALTSNVKVFSCGKGGSDGSPHGDKPHLLFTLVEGLPQVLSLSNGSTNHCAVITGSGEVFVWGNNQHGQLGVGDTVSRDAPTKLELNGIKLLKLSMGETHTTALIDLHSLLAEQANPQPTIIVESEVKPVTKEGTPSKEPSTTETKEVPRQETPKEVIKETPKEEHGLTKPESRSTMRQSSPKMVVEPQKKIAGYMNKKGEKGLVKTYKKRWFQIEGDIIGYYDKEGGTLKGCIYVADILDVLPSPVKFGINVVSAKKRVYELHKKNRCGGLLSRHW
jgi:hypothetical protein